MHPMHPLRDPLQPSPTRTIHLADYRPPAWQIPEVALRFELDATDTLVHATLQLRRNDAPSANGHTLRLQGEELETLAIAIDGKPVVGPLRHPVLTPALANAGSREASPDGGIPSIPAPSATAIVRPGDPVMKARGL